jgi:hypothetical protein
MPAFPRRALACSLLLSLAACVSGAENAARARAADDLRCPRTDMTMTKLDDGAYQAQGCGGYGVYRCVRHEDMLHDEGVWDCSRQSP